MGHGLLPEHIGPLVDRLRNGDHHSVSLPDVADRDFDAIP